jgi:hypothetical protein
VLIFQALNIDQVRAYPVSVRFALAAEASGAWIIQSHHHELVINIQLKLNVNSLNQSLEVITTFHRLQE